MWRAAPWAALLVVPLVAHAPELAGLVSSNPPYFVSGLGHGARPPLLDGSPGWIDPNVGFTTQALGREAARQWLHGQIPWWNHNVGIGVPLAAEMQCAALFLPFVLLLGAFDGVLYLKIALQIVAGLAGFALLRQLAMSRRTALLGATLFELNGTFCWTGHAPMLPVAFLPVVLLGIERARMAAANTARGGWAWLGIGIAYAVYAGFPETSLIYLLLAGAWALWRLLEMPAHLRLPFAVKMAAGGMCGLLLATPAILPFLQLVALGDLGAHAGANGGILAKLGPTSAAHVLLPSLLGPPSYDWKWGDWGMAGGFVGLPLAAIASLAVRRGTPDFGLRLVLALWCVAALAISGGLIPFPHEIWFARYAAPSWEMAAIILASCTLEDWHRGIALRRGTLVGVGAAWSVAALCAVASAWPAMRHLQADHRAFAAFPVATLGTTVLIGTLCAWCLARRCTHRAANTLFGVLACQALALAIFPLASGARSPSYDKEAMHFLASHLGQARFSTLGPIAPNYGSFFATASINHNLLPVPRLWVEYVRAHLDPAMDAISFTGAYPPGVWPPGAPGGQTRAEALWRRLPAYEALGVAYVVAPPGMQAGTPDARLVFADAALRIYALANPAPYFEVRGGACTIAPVSRDAVRLACRNAGQLVRRELFFPGWHARIGDTDAPVEATDTVFQAVAVPQGEHVVAFTYAPPWSGWTAAAFILGAAMLAKASARKSVQP